MQTILLADDETNLRMLVRATLEGPKYRIIEAANGAEALELARRERPDVVLLDWMMPGMSGIEVVSALRAEPSTSAIPVVMLTAKGQQKDREEALRAGARTYLVKPFSPLELLNKVEGLLQASASEERAQ